MGTGDVKRRKRIRLPGYDYSRPGYYFVTVCVKGHVELFGAVEKGVMHWNAAGHMVDEVWRSMPEHYPGISVDSWIVMPNHVHGIVVIGDDGVGAGPRPGPHLALKCGRPQGAARTLRSRGAARTTAGAFGLSDIMHRFKSLATMRYMTGVRGSGWPPFDGQLWQRSYHDHIIRDDADLARVRGYIRDNPGDWEEHKDDPEAMHE
jgi:putative transposase